MVYEKKAGNLITTSADYAELSNVIIFLSMSVRMRGTTWMPLDKLSRKIISDYISTHCREN